MSICQCCLSKTRFNTLKTGLSHPNYPRNLGSGNGNEVFLLRSFHPIASHISYFPGQFFILSIRPSIFIIASIIIIGSGSSSKRRHRRKRNVCSCIQRGEKCRFESPFHPRIWLVVDFPSQLHDKGWWENGPEFCAP